MATKKEDNRSTRLFIRVTPDEYEIVKERTAKTGLNISEYARLL